jgi:perosamine synthetase
MTLAIHGGRPVRDDFLPYGQQWIDDEDIESVIATLASPWITQGPKIPEFEEKVAQYVGARYAVAFSNGTAALHAACYAAGVGQGDEVITSPITFVASANCALYVGAKPVFVDINSQTYNLDTDLIEKAITPNTRAIIPVDFTGQPVDMDVINDIAKKHKFVVIQDAAHSFGATYKGEKVGKLADMTMFSFHPVKHITTGEGGLIATDSEEYAEKLRLFRSHGITKDNVQVDEGPWYYEMVDLGYNYRMTDIQAALGITQLKKIDQFVDARRRIASYYHQKFSNLDGVITHCQHPETNSSWHLYILRLELGSFKVDRREIFEALRAENIGVHVHYIPVHFQPYYKNLGYKKGLCPIAEKWYEEVMTLPLFPKMLQSDMDSVVEGVKKVLNYYKKLL